MKITILGSGTSNGVPQIGCPCEVCTSADPKDKRLRCSSMVEVGGKRILFDCSPDFREQMLRIDFKPLDAVLITHEHYDHFDPVSISKIMNGDSAVIAPESMKKKLLKELAVNESQCVFCLPKTTHELTPILVETVPAYNNIKPFHTKSSKWLGYIVTMDDISYYIAGDTDANEDVKKVSCDVALIPIGGHYTMDKKQAAELICSMKPKAVIPTHYGEVVGKPKDGLDFMEMVNHADGNILVELKMGTVLLS